MRFRCTLGANWKELLEALVIFLSSFYGSHVISCAGNGGILLTNDKKNI